MSDKPVAAGKSSFDLIDTGKAFEIMDFKPYSSCLDLACGSGKYSIEIAKKMGGKGTVYAIDIWQGGLDALHQAVDAQRIKNVKTILADIRNKLPLEDNSIDVCLLATILHDLSKSDQKLTVQEAARLVKPDGMLYIIEFKKIDTGPGPPVKIRMSEAAVEALVTQYGFIKIAEYEVGEFNYLLKYKKVT